jgi:APA family basic amino acid/polyamine antiporter
MTTAEAPAHGPALKRTIGLVAAIGFGLGSMVGTGVFVYTGVASGMAGAAVLVSVILAGLAAACNGLSSAELAAVYPRSGGTYDYAGRLLSPWAGFLAGWLFLAAKTTSAAATALGFGAYVGELTSLPPLALSGALVAGVTILNLFRLTKAGLINLALVSVSVLALAAFVATGLSRVSPERFTPFAPHGLRGVLSASALLFVAYAGYGRIATMGEEVKDPRRTIPIALVTSLGFAAFLYVLVTAVAVGSIGAEAFAAAAGGGAPLEAAAGPGWVKAVLSLGAATALGSVFLNLMLGLSRMAFAMARGNDLPGPIAKVNAASSPFVAVAFVGAAVGALVAIRSIVGLVSVSAFTVLVYYGLTNLSALRLKREERLVHPAVPWAGLAFCLSLAASVPLRHLAAGASVLAAGVVWRALWTSITRKT